MTASWEITFAELFILIKEFQLSAQCTCYLSGQGLLRTDW